MFTMLVCAIEELIKITSIVASIRIIHCFSARSCGMFTMCHRGNNIREPLLLPVFVLFIAPQQGHLVCLLCAIERNNKREPLLLPVFVLFIAKQGHMVCLLCAIEEIIKENLCCCQYSYYSLLSKVMWYV